MLRTIKNSIKSDDQEIDDRPDKIAVCDAGLSNIDCQAGEIHTPKQDADQGHDDVIHQQGNDGRERSSDHNSNRPGRSHCPHGKLAEFSNHD